MSADVTVVLCKKNMVTLFEYNIESAKLFRDYSDEITLLLDISRTTKITRKNKGPPSQYSKT